MASYRIFNDDPLYKPSDLEHHAELLAQAYQQAFWRLCIAFTGIVAAFTIAMLLIG